MIIPINRQSLCINIDIDTGSSSNKCEYILTQNPEEVASYELTDFSEFPSRADLLSRNEFVSQRDRDSKTLGIYEFSAVSVNGKKVETDSNFCIYIRRSSLAATHPKVVLVYSKSFRVDGTNIDNWKVLTSISEMLGNQGFVVDAFRYIEVEKRLDFVVNIYGFKAKMSQIFGKRIPLRKYMPIEQSKNEISQWNNIEFGSYCISLIREYELYRIVPLLLDVGYCSDKERFNLENKAVLKEEYSEGYHEEAFLIDNARYYLLMDFEGKREKIWMWLLQRIAEVSRDVKVEKRGEVIIGLPLPARISFDKNDELVTLKKRVDYEISLGQDIDKGVLVEFEGKVGVSVNRDGTSATLDYGKYYKLFDLVIGDKVILTDSMVTRLLSYSLYSVGAIEEQYTLLKRDKAFIDQDSEQYIIKKIQEEIHNGD